MGMHRQREPNHQAIQTPVHPISYTLHQVRVPLVPQKRFPDETFAYRVQTGKVGRGGANGMGTD